jgi:hypothetical protein
LVRIGTMRAPIFPKEYEYFRTEHGVPNNERISFRFHKGALFFQRKLA